MLAAAATRPLLAGSIDAGVVQTWTTVFVSMCLQSTPFLVFGVLVSGAISAFVSAGRIARLLPKRPAATVPVAGMAGMLLPGCECGAVPISSRLMQAGVPRPAALTFLLAAPAVNPIVLVATAVAFAGRPEFVVARFVAAMATAIAVGWVTLAAGLHDRIRLPRPRPVGTSKWATFRLAMVHDFVHAGGFLVVGAAFAASLQEIVPRSVIDSVAGQVVVGVVVLAVLAFVLAICSEADAFVAASMWQFSPTARLAFTVVGPVVDIKLVSMQHGLFGRGFAFRFAALSFGVAIAASVGVGWLML